MSRVVDATAAAPVRADALSTLIEDVRQSARANALGYRDRLDALNGLSDVLLRGGGPRLSAAGGAFLAGFLRSSNLESLLARELPMPAALDGFVSAGERKSVHLAPKGVVCHWVAGNVPLLGMFSWAVSAITGNANVIRLSSRQDDLMSPLLEILKTTNDAGRHMVRSTAIVQFDRDDRQAHEALSEAADVRIAWGGLEAVEAIRDLPARWDCETIVFGPRVSLAVVDPKLTTDRIMSRLVTDVIYFDQLACSSPQCLFVKGRPGEAVFDEFLRRFTTAFAAQAGTLTRHPLDWGETYRILLDRARIVLGGGALSADAATSWTVALVEEPQPVVTCANRFLQVIPYHSLDEIYPHVPSNAQTMVTLVEPDDLERLTRTAAARGICRFPRPGEGNHFESPWDDVPLFSRLVRWVVRTDPSAADRQTRAATQRNMEERNG